MQPLDWFQTIGAGLASLLTLVMLGKYASPLIRKLWSKLTTSYKQWRNFRWFKKYCPAWEIVNISPLKVRHIGEKFRLDFSLEIKYTSRDTRYPTSMDCNTILIDIYNKGKGREKRPYRLHSKLEEGIWSLPPAGKRTIRYDFSTEEIATPFLGKKTICQIILIGEAHVAKLPFSADLKAGKRFKVNVVWE